MKTDMTKGDIQSHLTRFAIPLILGNIFQLTYNAVDSIVVGRYVGNEAQAAVGTSNPLMNIIVFFIIGICTGTSVLMSMYFGAKEYDKLKREISTSMIVGTAFTLGVTVLTIVLAKPLLLMIQTPTEILSLATGYLRVVCIGLVFTFLYNIYAATLRSMGDSKTPIYFLVFSSILNIILDFVLVAWLDCGVNGVGYATVLSQMTSSILCMLYVRKRVPMMHFTREEFVVDKTLLKDTINYSWSTAIQKIALNVGKVLVQGCVNSLGVDAIATFNAVSRVDDFVFQPQQSIGSAMTTFIAQNKGAGKKDRIQKSLKIGLIMETVYWVGIGSLIYLVSDKIMHLFVEDSTNRVVSMGVSYLRAMALFYFMPAMTNGIQGYFRGLGKLNINFYSTFIQMIGRVSMAYVLVPRLGVFGIALSCFIGWVVMLLYEVPYYFWYRSREKKLEREQAVQTI